MSHYPQSLARAWISFNASSGTPSIGAAHNATITDDGVGKFTVNFTRAFSDANYSVAGSARYNNASASSAAGMFMLRRQATAAKTTTTCAIQFVYLGGPSLADLPECNAIFVGNVP